MAVALEVNMGSAAGPHRSRRTPRRPLVLLLQLRVLTARTLASGPAGTTGG